MVDIPLIFLLFASGRTQDIRSLYGYVLKHSLDTCSLSFFHFFRKLPPKKEKGKEIETRKEKIYGEEDGNRLQRKKERENNVV